VGSLLLLMSMADSLTSFTLALSAYYPLSMLLDCTFLGCLSRPRYVFYSFFSSAFDLVWISCGMQ
jgi:hypothetical protein